MLVRSSPRDIRMKLAIFFIILSIFHINAFPTQNGPTHSVGNKNACIVVTNDVIYQIDDITRELEEFVSALSEKYLHIDLRLVKIAIDRHNDVDKAKETMLNIYINDCAGIGDTKLTHDELKTLKRKRKEVTGIAYKNQKNTRQVDAKMSNQESTQELSFLEMLIKNLQSYFNVKKHSADTPSVDEDIIADGYNKPEVTRNIDITASTMKSTIKATSNENTPKVNRNIEIASTNKKYDTIESLYTINESNNNQPEKHEIKDRKQIFIVNNEEKVTKDASKNIDSAEPVINKEMPEFVKYSGRKNGPSGIINQDILSSFVKSEIVPPKIIHKHLTHPIPIDIEKSHLPVADTLKPYNEIVLAANTDNVKIVEPSATKAIEGQSAKNIVYKMKSSGTLHNNSESFLKSHNNIETSKTQNPLINNLIPVSIENNHSQSTLKTNDEIKLETKIEGSSIEPNTATIKKNKNNKGIPKIVGSISEKIIDNTIKSTVSKLKLTPEVSNKDDTQETLIRDDMDHDFSNIIASIENLENNVTKIYNTPQNITDNNNDLENVNNNSKTSTDNVAIIVNTTEKGLKNELKTNAEGKFIAKETSSSKNIKLDDNNVDIQNTKKEQLDVKINSTAEKTKDAIKTIEIVTDNINKVNHNTLTSNNSIPVKNSSRNDKKLDTIEPTENIATAINNNNKDKESIVITNYNTELSNKIAGNDTEQSSTTENVKEFVQFFNNFFSSFIESPKGAQDQQATTAIPVVNIENSKYEPGAINIPFKTDDVNTIIENKVETSPTAVNDGKDDRSESSEAILKYIDNINKSNALAKSDDTESITKNVKSQPTAINTKSEEISEKIIIQNTKKSTNYTPVRKNNNLQPIGIQNEENRPSTNKKLEEILNKSTENKYDASEVIIKNVKSTIANNKIEINNPSKSINSEVITKTSTENSEKSKTPFKNDAPERIITNENIQRGTVNNNVEINNLSTSTSSEEIVKTSAENTGKSVATTVESTSKNIIFDETILRNNNNIKVKSTDDIIKTSSIESTTNKNEFTNKANIEIKSNDYSSNVSNILDTYISETSAQSKEVQSRSSVESLETISTKTNDESQSSKEEIYNDSKEIVSQTDKDNKEQDITKLNTGSVIKEHNIKSRTDDLINIDTKFSIEEAITHETVKDAKQMYTKVNDEKIAKDYTNSQTDLKTVIINKNNNAVENIATTEKIVPLITTTDNYQQTSTNSNIRAETTDSIEILKRMLNDGKYNPQFTDSNESTEQIDITIGSIESTEKALNIATESASINKDATVSIEKDGAAKYTSELRSKTENHRADTKISKSGIDVDLNARILTTEKPMSVGEDEIISEKRVKEYKTNIENVKELNMREQINNINEKTTAIKNVIRESFVNANSKNVFVKPTIFDHEYLTRQLGFSMNEIQLLYSLRRVIKDEVQYHVNKAIRQLDTEGKISEVDDRILDHMNEDKTIKYANEEEYNVRYFEDLDKNLHSDNKTPDDLEKPFPNEDQLYWDDITRDPMTYYYIRQLK